MIEEKVKELLATKFEEEGFEDCFFVDVAHRPTNNRLEVFIDCDDRLTLGKCQKISRYLEGFIDEKGWLGEKYVIEVSSPGLTKPLKLKRQYYKNVGRAVKVFMKDWGAAREGVLKAADDEKIILEEEVIIKEKKKKRKELVEVEIPYDSIDKTIVQIVFK